MGTNLQTHRFIIYFLCFLFSASVDSSPVSSVLSPVLSPVRSSVGGQAVLPCSWRSRLGVSSPPSPCHVQWTLSPPGTVFEMRGDRKWQAEEFRGRVEVEGQRLQSGDCSLIISDVQILDTGNYESFMVLDGHMEQKSRVFIQSVRLTVLDHKSQETRSPGEDLVLPLYTSHSVRVLFQDRNSSDWSDLWMRGDNDTERVQKDEEEEQLTIKTLTPGDEGTYKVLDQHGLSVSTVRLSLHRDHVQQEAEGLQHSDAAGRSFSSWSLLLWSLLLVSLLLD